jgi:hypothetical protein
MQKNSLQNSTLRRFKILFAGKCMELENIVLSEISQVQKDKDHIFAHMWKIDPNVNTKVTIYTYTYTYTYTYIYTKNTSPKVRLLEQTKGEGKEEMNDRK